MSDQQPIQPQSGGHMTKDQLHRAMPHAPADVIERFVGPLNDAMDRFEINTPIRKAMFLAQLAHESGCLRYMAEIASGQAYEGRKDLGNTEKGDGIKYKGRGPIQITGKANYASLSKALGVDFVASPALLEGPIYGCMAAAWFWKMRGLNELADEGLFVKITQRINGGTNGLPQRLEYLALSRPAFGLPA